MNYIDMFILVLLIYAVYRGFTRGFILQLTILAARLRDPMDMAFFLRSNGTNLQIAMYKLHLHLR